VHRVPGAGAQPPGRHLAFTCSWSTGGEPRHCPYASAAAYAGRLRALHVRSELIAELAASHRLTDETDYYARVPPLFEHFFLETLT
jgi:hypothetical protein